MSNDAENVMDDIYNELYSKYEKLLSFVHSLTKRSCCNVCNSCLSCDALFILREIGEEK